MDQVLVWRMSKTVEDEQRRRLGLPKATGPASRGSPNGIAGNPGLRRDLLSRAWQPNGRNGMASGPFVGALTMELPTQADEEVAAWDCRGNTADFFGFGSIAVESSADTLAMISRPARSWASGR